MQAIILHDKEENVIGTVILKEGGTYAGICDAWDTYLENLGGNEPDIYVFVSLGNWEMCKVLEVEFYQP